MSGLLQLTATSNDELLNMRRPLQAHKLKLERVDMIFSSDNSTTHAQVDLDFLEGFNISNENGPGIILPLDTVGTNRHNVVRFNGVEYKDVTVPESVHVRCYDADGDALVNIDSVIVTFEYQE